MVGTELYTGAGGNAAALAVQSDGKILVGGSFFTPYGPTGEVLLRLSPDLTWDSDLRYELSSISGSSVTSMTVQPDGKVVIGGFLTGQRTRVARLNADDTLDSSFQTGFTIIDHLVFALGIQEDGKVILGGHFNIVQGVSRNRIARLNPDGTLDNSFQSGADDDV